MFAISKCCGNQYWGICEDSGRPGLRPKSQAGAQVECKQNWGAIQYIEVDYTVDLLAKII